jgi:Fe-S-cluster containining protein
MAIDDLANAQEQVEKEGIPQIKCEPQICGAACCHNEIGLNLYDMIRLINAGHQDSITNKPNPRGIPGFHMPIPAYIPILKKENGKCIFLSDELRCKIYDIRPDICRFYPYTKNSRCKFPTNLSPEEKAGIKANIEMYNSHLKITVYSLFFDRELLQEEGILDYFTKKI